MDEDPKPTLTDDLYALVVHLHATCNRDLLEAIAHSQLTSSELLMLDRLRGGRRNPTIQQAASMIGVSQTGASRIADKLARRGFIQRETDDKDYRRKRISITPKGEDAMRRLHAARLERVDAFTAGLSAEERDRLTDALAKLLEREQIAACRPEPIAA